MNLKNIHKKYRDISSYLFFGICTTLVNVLIYWAAAHVFGFGVMASTVLAWILAVLFAYITNRRWVFRSEARGGKEISKEMLSFFSCRLATGVVDWACMFIFVDLMDWNDVIIKILANAAVIALNYITSRLIIFRRR